MQKCILIVEDNELTMQLFNDLLEAHGYKPLPSRSGVEVLETACTNSVLDIQLPDVSGLHVTQGGEHLRHPVIAKKIRQGGCESYIAKPFFIETFLETVRNYLHEP